MQQEKEMGGNNGHIHSFENITHTWKNHSNVLPQAAFISIKTTYHSLVPINPET